MRYNIFAGLGGGYGGAVWTRTVECLDTADAMSVACEDARETWESYGGVSGIEGYTYDEYLNDYPDGSEDDYDCADGESFDSWADFYVEEVPADAPADYEYDGDLK